MSFVLFVVSVIYVIHEDEHIFKGKELCWVKQHC